LTEALRVGSVAAVLLTLAMRGIYREHSASFIFEDLDVSGMFHFFGATHELLK